MEKKINEEDMKAIRQVQKDGGDVLLKTEDLGYTINRDTVIELVVSGIDTGMMRKTTTHIQLQPEEAQLPIAGKVMRNKIFELYGKDEYQLIAVAHKYHDYPIRLNKIHPSYEMKTVWVKEYMKRIVRGIGMYKCTSLNQIQNFRLGEEDETIRKGFQISGQAPE